MTRNIALRSRALIVVLVAAVGLSVMPTTAWAAGPPGSLVGRLVGSEDVGGVDGLPGTVTATNLADGTVFSGTANALGDYSIPGVPAGRYLVSASFTCTGCITPLWAGNTPQRSQATVVVVGTEPKLTDFFTDLGATVSGTIADASGQNVGRGAQAFLIDPATGEPGEWSKAAVASGSGNYTLRGIPAGDYLVRFAPSDVLFGADYWEGADWILDAQHLAVGEAAIVSGVDGTIGSSFVSGFRFDGADRFGAAVRVSEQFDANIDTVFVVNGLNFPDALSAGPAAARAGGPILLVTPTAIPAVVAAELTRLNPELIVVVGGPNSVSQPVFDQLAGYATDIMRISGADRFDASRNVVSVFFPSVDTVYIATGNNFPDALAAGAAATNEGGPVLLVNGKATSVDLPTAALLADLGADRIVIAGGPASVTPELAASLAALPGISEVTRRTGATRFDAAAEINFRSFKVADTVFLATGFNFPDALAGGPLAGGWGAPIYLVQRSCVPWSVIDELIRLQPHELIVLGGPNSVADDVFDLVPCA